MTLRIQTIVKPSGKRYVYTRMPGLPRVRLPDLPTDHPDFLLAYAKAAALAPQPISRPATGTIAAACDAFLASDRFLALSKVYRRTMFGHIGAIRKQGAAGRLIDLRPAHIRADLAPLAPHASRARRKAWRLLCAFATETGLIEDDPSETVKAKRAPKSDGNLPWSRDHIEAFRARWPIGTVPRLCMELLHWTGARIGDAVTLGPGMVGSDGVLAYRQAKTGGPAFVPLTCPLPPYAAHMAADRAFLHATLDARTEKHMTWLATAQGRPRSHKALGNVVSGAARLAAFERSAHGLRKSLCQSLADGGATAHQIMAWSGHASLSEAEHYTRGSDRRRAVMGTEQHRNLGNAGEGFRAHAKTVGASE